MSRRLALAVLAFAALFANAPSAQAPPEQERFVGTWTLVSIQRTLPGAAATTIANPRGMLAFDRAGLAIEIASGGARARGTNQFTPAEAQAAFSSYGGFWGRYRVDETRKTLVFTPDGAVNPNAMGKALARTFELAGDRLTLTAPADAPAADKGMRWVWERVPPLENLSEAQRQLVGFWQHVIERRVNADSGAVISETRRAPSIIVYTPSGYVGVHFPPLNRAPFAGELPTDEEARAVVSGYVGYYGVYLLYPGAVHHHQLANLNGNVVSFRRFLEFNGSEVNLKFPPQPMGGQMVRTLVTLKRLSGAADMLPR